MRISFITSGHFSLDDRIFFHLAMALVESNHQVEIVSSKEQIKDRIKSIEINSFNGDLISKKEKIDRFKSKLSGFNPDVIICSEPLPVMAARKFVKEKKSKAQVVYDITEWYPSKKNTGSLKFPLKQFRRIKLSLFNLVSAFMADAFIFGEWYKSRMYRFFFPRKPFVFTTYYPDLKYLNPLAPAINKTEINLSYSGKISKEKGFHNFFNVVNLLSETDKSLKINVKIIGWFDPDEATENKALLSQFNPNVTVKFFDNMPFESYLSEIKDGDIFMDLRKIDSENQRSLPIKLFYYAALQRPVIYSDLKAIRKAVEIDRFGFLVDPGDTVNIVKIIRDYIRNSEQYIQHCNQAALLAETTYNWNRIKPGFVAFINKRHPN